MVKSIQDFHMNSRNYSDIAYNFLVSSYGNIFMGRGWFYYGSHSRGWNIGSVGIAFIGTFTNVKPTDEQVEAVKIIIKIGVMQGFISDDYKLYAHSQCIDTESPGAGIYEIIKKWPHWKNTTF